jgi:hypothetical protein
MITSKIHPIDYKLNLLTREIVEQMVEVWFRDVTVIMLHGMY